MNKALWIQTYETLMESVGEYSLSTDALLDGEEKIASFSQLLTSRATEISEFNKVTDELTLYLDNYPFQTGCQFEDVQNQLHTLFRLRDKLQVMTLEARKVDDYPEVYGSKRIVELCRNLVLTCKDKLSLKDIERVEEIIESNTKKLLILQEQFSTDGFILERIREAVNNAQPLLKKYKALFKEIQQYVDGFPHTGEDNLLAVEKRINVAVQMDALLKSVEEQMKPIATLYNRHGKDLLMSRYSDTINETYGKMDSTNWESFKARLENIVTQIPSILSAFENERNALVLLNSSLDRNYVLWREDSEKLKRKLSTLLSTDTNTVHLNLDDLNREIQRAQTKRETDIKQMTDHYPWLLRKKHCGFHENLIARYITYAEYESSVDAVRRERIKKIWKGIGIGIAVVAGVVLLYYIIVGIIAILVALGVLSMAARSSD
jgi:hypothetical protein